jgi:meiotically up-regulated gene 157 (Mug157) protein
MRGLTSDNDEEIQYCIDQLMNSTENTGFMHESFNVNNATDYTRDWFAWSNVFFGHFINTVAKERSHLLFKEKK